MIRQSRESQKQRYLKLDEYREIIVKFPRQWSPASGSFSVSVRCQWVEPTAGVSQPALPLHMTSTYAEGLGAETAPVGDPQQVGSNHWPGSLSNRCATRWSSFGCTSATLIDQPWERLSRSPGTAATTCSAVTWSSKPSCRRKKPSLSTSQHRSIATGPMPPSLCSPSQGLP
ncbi:hypothetical protein GGR56DRAFT_644413 [Xylariaceae sp. FL0804]|nr:hypothetical protein GGR56DRAFT_644413 [Xylariaceae sp. FL0804]